MTELSWLLKVGIAADLASSCENGDLNVCIAQKGMQHFASHIVDLGESLSLALTLSPFLLKQADEVPHMVCADIRSRFRYLHPGDNRRRKRKVVYLLASTPSVRWICSPTFIYFAYPLR